MTKSKVQIHFDRVSEDYDYYKKKNKYYYDNLKKLLKKLILPNSYVFEVGCGTGDLLVSLDPKKGYGVDLSNEMITIAKNKYAKYKKNKFSTSWPKKRDIFRSKDGKSSYIFMSDVIEHLEKPKEVLTQISGLMGPKTIFVNTMANPLWEPILMLWENLGWKMPEGPHKRIRYKDIKVLSDQVGLKIIKHDYKLLVPVKIPFVTEFANTYLEKYLRKLAFIEYFVAVKL